LGYLKGLEAPESLPTGRLQIKRYIGSGYSCSGDVLTFSLVGIGILCSLKKRKYLQKASLRIKSEQFRILSMLFFSQLL
jgi:hypothetical protein